MIYRRSSISEYYVWDLKNKKLIPVSENGKQQLATFSPDGNKIAFVRNNNIYIKDLSTLTEVQISKDGLKNSIINGAPDWVYEEEFGFSKAFEWSPDGSKIAYMKFDESKVKEFDLMYFGNLYPDLYKYKYPKPGEENSIVTVWIYDLNKKSNVKVNVGNIANQYIPRIKWTKLPNTLSFVRLNRLQNEFEMLEADAVKGVSTIVISEKNKYYFESVYDIYFLKDNSFIYKSEKSGFMHLYLHDASGKLIKQLTDGEWEVGDLTGVDEEKGIVYYSSNEPATRQRAIYSVKLDGTDKKRLTPEDGSVRITFSKNFKYYVKSYSNANTPSYITTNSIDGNVIKVLRDNKKLRDLMEEKQFIKKEFFTFKSTDGYQINGWIMKPANLEPGKKYPLLFSVYGGPGSQTVIDAWGGGDYIWYQMFCQKGYVIAEIDGRGTGGRGEEFQKCNYMKLGTTEIESQIEAAKYLGTLDYIDKDRIGIWGWSYGGYATIMTMLKGADYYKMGVAVAPVTDWKYYDDIYTERFMRRPEDNPDGYKEGSAITHADKLKGKLLIIHGAADDNVHMQNSMDFITALIAANKQYEMQIYPNKNHGIFGGNTRYHLFKRITEYILADL
ncbi:S9 family peptidase [bacterium]|nr:MAG: S9 family peptidase [bacterium]